MYVALAEIDRNIQILASGCVFPYFDAIQIYFYFSDLLYHIEKRQENQ